MVKQGMETVKELRVELIREFKENSIESPETSSGLIIMQVLGIDKTRLLVGDLEVGTEEADIIRKYAKRLIDGEPIQYITGVCEFMSLEFLVGRNVLIPRSDTETLVEAVIERLGTEAVLSAVDIGCGSGIIGISLAYYLKNLSVTGIDISEDALGLAERNAEKNGVSGRIRFMKLDILKDFPDICVDCIVSNPPYIRTAVIPVLDERVREYEPLLALDGGEDGLTFYRRLAAAPMLKGGGLLALEIGYDQGREVAELLKASGFKEVEVLQDIEGRDRVVLGIKE